MNEDAIAIDAWEVGIGDGRRLADEIDAVIGRETDALETPLALRVYSDAYIDALVQSYRAAMRQHLRARVDIAREREL